VMSMPAVLEQQKGGDALISQILTGFALLALALAAIGIYGLIAYSVGQRTHEIGIRMAMGAGKPQVLRMVLRDGLRMGIVGAAIGLVFALPLPKLFASMFFGFPASEPLFYILVPVVLLAVAMLATYIPARRATYVDPMRALRQE
jgi:putative ABC transport system permease protein